MKRTILFTTLAVAVNFLTGCCWLKGGSCGSKEGCGCGHAAHSCGCSKSGGCSSCGKSDSAPSCSSQN